MKKLLIVLIAVILLSCGKEGQIQSVSARHIKINGKEYRFMKIIPADGYDGVWLLVPKDANVDIPMPTSYNFRRGKHSVTVSCIWIK